MSKKKQQRFPINPIEAIRGISETTTELIREELVKPIAGDAVGQIFGKTEPARYHAEFSPGESVEMKEMASGPSEREKFLAKQLMLERKLREEETVYVEQRTNELRIQMKAIHEEVIKLAQVTPQLSQEVEIAAFQIPIEPSVYELNFLQHLLDFIQSFRKKIESASTWLASCNHRAQKKNRWGANYKKHGARYLLSGEHYLTRSAG